MPHLESTYAHGMAGSSWKCLCSCWRWKSTWNHKSGLHRKLQAPLSLLGQLNASYSGFTICLEEKWVARGQSLRGLRLQCCTISRSICWPHNFHNHRSRRECLQDSRHLWYVCLQSLEAALTTLLILIGTSWFQVPQHKSQRQIRLYNLRKDDMVRDTSQCDLFFQSQSFAMRNPFCRCWTCYS